MKKKNTLVTKSTNSNITEVMQYKEEMEIKDYVILQRREDNLSPPHTLITTQFPRIRGGGEIQGKEVFRSLCCSCWSLITPMSICMYSL